MGKLNSSTLSMPVTFVKLRFASLPWVALGLVKFNPVSAEDVDEPVAQAGLDTVSNSGPLSTLVQGTAIITKTRIRAVHVLLFICLITMTIPDGEMVPALTAFGVGTMLRIGTVTSKMNF